MLISAITLSALFYTLSVYLELVASTSRPAGALIAKNSMGYTTHGLISTVKRIFMVLYPPCIGVVATLGNKDDIYFAIYVCFIASFVGLIVSTITRKHVLIYQLRFIYYLSNGAGLLVSAQRSIINTDHDLDEKIKFMLIQNNVNISRFLNIKEIDWRICLLCCYVMSFYSISIFAINIIAIHFVSYNSILYQLVGIVNAFGTLIWAFILDPMLSRRFDHCDRVVEVTDSIFAGNWLANLFLAPALTACLIYVLEA